MALLLEWNRTVPPEADCRGAWARAVRDPARSVMLRYYEIISGEWRHTIATHCAMRGKEIRWR